MEYIDVFNGDADGIFSLHQLRLSCPRKSHLVTGLKREVDLLKIISCQKNSEITVLDISIDANEDSIKACLAGNNYIHWFDHHRSSRIPSSPMFFSHIDTSSHICTGLIVDRYLGRKHHEWAVAAAYGDNLRDTAERESKDIPMEHWNILKMVGENINYNGYGEDISDLIAHPVDVYHSLKECENVMEYAESSAIYKKIAQQRILDEENLENREVLHDNSSTCAILLPRGVGSRRISGIFSNQIAHNEPSRAHAVLTTLESGGGYRVSIRAPTSRPEGADRLAVAFLGGGRAGAAGINSLPEGDLDRFIREFIQVFKS